MSLSSTWFWALFLQWRTWPSCIPNASRFRLVAWRKSRIAKSKHSPIISQRYSSLFKFTNLALKLNALNPFFKLINICDKPSHLSVRDRLLNWNSAPNHQTDFSKIDFHSMFSRSFVAPKIVSSASPSFSTSPTPLHPHLPDKELTRPYLCTHPIATHHQWPLKSAPCVWMWCVRSARRFTNRLDSSAPCNASFWSVRIFIDAN